MTVVDWNKRFSARTNHKKDDSIKEILALTQKPEMISFAGGIPAAEFFPIERIREATNRVLANGRSAEALQYGLTEGYVPLRQFITERMQAMGIPCSIQNILITSGSQQSLDMIGKTLIDPGDRIIVEEPTYMGMLDAWRLYGADYCGVESDEFGTDPFSLEDTLVAGAAKLIYTVPNFHNPTGVTTTPARRAEIVRMGRQYGVTIIEDDPYGPLRYDGDHLTPLIALDAEGIEATSADHVAGGNVLYLGTFSKSLCPGFRLAWIVGPIDAITKLTEIKLNADLHTSTFAQVVAYEVAKDGFLDEHLERLRAGYKERRDLMLALIEELFPPNVHWNRPEGGLFLWVQLPDHVNATDLLKHAVAEHQVAYVPGQPFYPHGGGHNTFRLNFSHASPDRIEEGIKRLSVVVRHSCEPA